MREQGLTLLELLVALAILAILLAVGLPGFSKVIQNSRLSANTEELRNAIQLTRAAAVSRNQRVTLRNLGRWESGWQAFADDNNNGVFDDGEQLLFSSGSLQSVRFEANTPVSNYVSFIGTGESRKVGSAMGAFQAGTIEVCTADNSQGYSLILFRSGRLRTGKLDANDCSPPDS
ncbi:GspH/FimT family pseudopilin [Microbulbifer rhizosphaerae]|uniref:Type II secretion system protein H n=1 Tax=Microbulbifer rhizosphaerae TaxID=1562603 RepID=A0A7W4WF08_9GAMM|nr:GspH/FimT family protein [Microbulbifer rhizosphaerae]MBB3063030.1 type IV fimbrial biogenesis protein FimT [Microbulbifer rhizosphaerae]